MNVKTTKKTPAAIVKLDAAVANIAMAFPDVVEEAPWGHRAFKIRKKSFLFSSIDGGSFSMSIKLPMSGVIALELPNVEPTGYGLGKSGWVTATFTAKDKLPLSVIEEWLDESYRAVTPKKLHANIKPRSSRR